MLPEMEDKNSKPDDKKEETVGEKITKCLSAMGLDEKHAEAILYCEITRLSCDERIPEAKKISILVSNEDHKLYMETIISFMCRQKAEGTKGESPINNIVVEIGENSSSVQEPINVIDFRNFDYDKEKNNLVERCNITIKSNRAIGDIIAKKDREEVKKPYDPKLIEKVQNLKQQRDIINERIMHYEESSIVMFRKLRLKRAYKEKEQIMTELNEACDEYRAEKSYRTNKSLEKRKRLSGILKKEEILSGIKYLMTGQKEVLESNLDEKSSEELEFITSPTEETMKMRRARERNLDRGLDNW